MMDAFAGRLLVEQGISNATLPGPWMLVAGTPLENQNDQTVHEARSAVAALDKGAT